MLSPELMKYTKQQNNEQKPQIISTDAKKKNRKKAVPFHTTFNKLGIGIWAGNFPNLIKRSLQVTYNQYQI